MKSEFWKHKLELFIGGTLITIFSLSMFLAGLILTLLNNIYLPILLIGLILVIITVLMFFSDRRILARVSFSEEGIEYKWLKITITSIKWTEVQSVETKSHGIAVNNLSFIAVDKHIDVGLTKKMYNAIMSICPDNNIKMEINDLQAFKYLHKKDD